MPQGREFKILRRLRRLKECTLLFILYCDDSNSLTLSNFSKPREVSSCIDPLRQGDVEKKIIKKVGCMGKFGTSLCFISPIYTTWGNAIPYPLSCALYFVYLALFLNWLSCLTLNLGLITEDSLNPRMTKI